MWCELKIENNLNIYEINQFKITEMTFEFQFIYTRLNKKNVLEFHFVSQKLCR